MVSLRQFPMTILLFLNLSSEINRIKEFFKIRSTGMSELQQSHNSLMDFTGLIYHRGEGDRTKVT